MERVPIGWVKGTRESLVMKSVEKRRFIQTLFETYYPRLIQRAYRLTTDRELAQDLVQDTFVLAFAHEEELARHPAPEGWLTLTLFNLVRNERRKLARQNCISLEEVHPCCVQETTPVEELLPSQLPQEERSLLIWHYEQQLSYTEMARRLGVSEHACRMRMSRALKKCRKLLAEKCCEG